METRCPQCQAKFNISAENKGEKVKCPKCEEVFVVEEVVEQGLDVCSGCGSKIGSLEEKRHIDGKVFCLGCEGQIEETKKQAAFSKQGQSSQVSIEICKQCGRELERSKQAYVFEGMIVCGDCNKKLRSGEERIRDSKTVKAIEYVKSQEDSENKISKAGIIISLVIFGLITMSIITGYIVKGQIQRPSSDIRFNYESLMMRHIDLFELIISMGACGCLVLRSFRPKLTFGRGIATFFGGFWVISILTAIITIFIEHGMPSNYSGPAGVLLGMLLAGYPGVLLLRFGFSTKGKFWISKKKVVRDN
jgi:predicted Zn finger-like uncharacterized protein